MTSTSRRRRLSVDLPAESETATRSLADRFFRGSIADVLRTALSLLMWTVDARRAGKRVVAVEPDELPGRFEEPVLPGMDEQLRTDWVWLVARPHPWRRQLWVKGRRLTAGDLARTAEIEGWTAERTASEFGLPIEAVLEAQRYLAIDRELVVAEERENALAAHAVTAQG